MEQKVGVAESSMNSLFQACIYSPRFAACRRRSTSVHLQFPLLLLFPVLMGFKLQVFEIFCEFNPAKQS
jgi:hypothetical protein